MEEYSLLSVGTPNPAGVTKVSSATTSARNSTALNKHTNYLVVSNSDCNFKLGDSTVTASSSDMFLPAKSFLVLNTGRSDFIAVIATSVDLYLAELIKQPEVQSAY